MNDKLKIRLADLVIDFLQNNTSADDPNISVAVGTLNKAWGLNGFKLAEPGNVVYERNGKYLIMLESIDGKVNLEVPFNKETLAPIINFYA
jgi:hypothetical protein